MAGVQLTPAQMRCLLVGPWALGFDLPDGEVTVFRHGNGWIYLEPTGMQEGESGVLVDPEGVVHYSPPAREQTGDPWPIQVLHKDDSEIILRVIKR